MNRSGRSFGLACIFDRVLPRIPSFRRNKNSLPAPNPAFIEFRVAPAQGVRATFPAGKKSEARRKQKASGARRKRKSDTACLTDPFVSTVVFSVYGYAPEEAGARRGQLGRDAFRAYLIFWAARRRLELPDSGSGIPRAVDACAGALSGDGSWGMLRGVGFCSLIALEKCARVSALLTSCFSLYAVHLIYPSFVGCPHVGR